jgi:hypothetical protein
MSPKLSPSTTALPQRPRKRKRAFEGFSLRNIDAYLDLQTNERPVSSSLLKSKQEVVMSGGNEDRAFMKTLDPWLVRHRSGSTTPGFQDHAFDSKLEKPQKQEAKNAFGNQGFDIKDVKGGTERIGWRRSTPWWLKDSARVAEFFRHEYGTGKDGKVLSNAELAKVAGTDLEILKSFYFFRMSDEEIWEEMEFDVFRSEANPKSAAQSEDANGGTQTRRRMSNSGVYLWSTAATHSTGPIRIKRLDPIHGRR